MGQFSSGLGGEQLRASPPELGNATQWLELPDVPYTHVCLTMPDVLWPMFQRNWHLLHDLPAVGAQVLQQWARACPN